MHRSVAVNHAIEILKLRIQAGANSGAGANELLAELNALIEGLTKIDDSARREGQF